MYHTHQTASASQQSWESAAKTNERQFSSGRQWSSLKCAAIRLSVEHRARRRELARPRRLRRNPTRATRTDASVSIIIISVVVISATAAAACVRGENDGTQVPASWPVTGCHLRRALLLPRLLSSRPPARPLHALARSTSRIFRTRITCGRRCPDLQPVRGVTCTGD